MRASFRYPSTIINTIPVGTNPQCITIIPDGSKVFVANSSDNTVSVINTSTNLVTATIAVDSLPDGLAPSPDGTKIYVSNRFANTVSVINTTTNSVSTTISVGTQPVGICVTPDGSMVYVANYFDGSVSVINTITNIVSTTIPVGPYPVAVGNFISSYVQPSGIPSFNKDPETITIYPNPSSTILNIHSQLSILNSQLLITDILGNDVYKETLNGIDNSVDVSHLSNGVYFYEVRSEMKEVRGKFIKTN